MKLRQEVFEAYVKHINEHPEENRAGALALKDNMFRSPLYFRDRYTSQTPQIPKIYDEETIAYFKEIVRTAYGIFMKVIREYLTHEDYRSLFPFSGELEELILLSGTEDALLPMARFDLFYHEDTRDFYFCEINTDGTSAMNEDRIQGKLILDNPAHQEIIRRYDLTQFELFDSWVKTFGLLYRRWPGHVADPGIAVVDFLDEGTYREFQEFARHFQRAGYLCEVCDIRELAYEGGVLYSKNGYPIHAIYRRAVTGDILRRAEKVRPFLQAVKDKAVFLCGPFATQIIHHKWLFHVLRLERTKRILTEEENAFVEAHIPLTGSLGTDFPVEEVLSHRRDYILKPMDSYGSNGIYAGVEQSGEDWERIVRDLPAGEYLCQRYAPQYQTKNIDFAWGDGQWHDYLNMAGLYVYHGEFAGVFSRQAEGDGIIASHRNERTVPTYLLKGRRGDRA
ncbi:MAG: hypothetical protein IKO80_00030 [Lachnospiraceae bacterium]|nr:hypothetical protein [Lachnospiraceae bacterium]